MKNDCDLICSGPSSKDVIIKTNKIIVANYSILNKLNKIIPQEKSGLHKYIKNKKY